MAARTTLFASFHTALGNIKIKGHLPDIGADIRIILKLHVNKS